MPVDLWRTLFLMERAARGAGEKMLRARDVLVSEKAGHANFVTNLDEEIERDILKALHGALPEATLIGEEKENAAGLGETAFVVDPIDGTTNFITGYPHSAVSIALLCRGEAAAGVVFNPYTNELFSAVRGEGASLGGMPIRAADRDAKRALVLFGTSPYQPALHARTFRAARDAMAFCADVRRSGSAALDLCFVAAGRADGFFEWRLSPWDYAAGALIAREAGALVDALPPDVFGYEKPIGVVAGSPRVFGDLREMVVRAAREDARD